MREKLVLVVEDEPAIRDMMQALVESLFSIEVLPAADGEEALALVSQRRPSLVLLDIMLPGITGLEVAKRLKSAPETQDIPIVAVTASISCERALSAGCDDFLQKPFDLDAFVGKVQSYLVGT